MPRERQGTSSELPFGWRQGEGMPRESLEKRSSGEDHPPQGFSLMIFMSSLPSPGSKAAHYRLAELRRIRSSGSFHSPREDYGFEKTKTSPVGIGPVPTAKGATKWKPMLPWAVRIA
jgi:hypothetical protein